jgi:hypothetical protein
MKPSGIKPATFLRVAQCLNHLRHCMPHSGIEIWLIVRAMRLSHMALLPQVVLPSQPLMVNEYSGLVEWQPAKENQTACRDACCKATLSATAAK